MPRLLSLFVIALLMLVFGATSAFADGGQTITPTSKQVGAILKGWAQGGATGPDKCYNIKISKHRPYLAGLAFNAKASGCMTSAFDGTAILWGRKTTWNVLTGASAMPNSNCIALKSLLGVNAWQDLSGFVAGMGCKQVD
ncbi:MAG: hypothetical protein EXQ67_08605 [Thermoleophilia bacterium]|nr:hypothetical protein [Thermoleophilia bacterium]